MAPIRRHHDAPRRQVSVFAIEQRWTIQRNDRWRHDVDLAGVFPKGIRRSLTVGSRPLRWQNLDDPTDHEQFVLRELLSKRHRRAKVRDDL
jgi:hypothetical protein